MSILEIIIFLPIVGAVLCFVGLPPRAVATATAGLNLALGIYLYFWSRGHPDPHGYLLRTKPTPLAEFPEITWGLGIDGIALVLVLLATLVTLAAVLAPPSDSRHPKLLYAAPSLISAGALGAFLSTDIFFFYAFHELALIPTFLLIGLCGHGERKAAAWKITIYLGTGSLVLLAGLAALVSIGGESLTFDMVKLREAAAADAIPPARQSFVFALLLCGFGSLVSLFPLHSWAAPAYAAAPTPVAMLHAGVLKKFGLYGLLRLASPLLPDALQAPWLLNLILVLLLGNIIVVGLVTIAQTELDRMVASSSVMHMGYIFLGIASFNTLGTARAVILMFAHGLSIALLFALVGHLRDSLGSLRFASAGGIGKYAPLFTLAFGAAAFASIGLPGFANFAGEAMVFLAAFKNMGQDGFGPLQWATVLAVWGVVISAVYMLRAFRAIFQGEHEGAATAAASGLDARPRWRLPAALLVAALLLLGIFPSLFTRLLPQDNPRDGQAARPTPAAEIHAPHHPDAPH